MCTYPALAFASFRQMLLPIILEVAWNVRTFFIVSRKTVAGKMFLNPAVVNLLKFQKNSAGFYCDEKMSFKLSVSRGMQF